VDAVLQAWRKCFNVTILGYEFGLCLEVGLVGPVEIEACVSQWAINPQSATFRLTVIVKALWIKISVFDADRRSAAAAAKRTEAKGPGRWMSCPAPSAMEPAGLEPATSALQRRRSSS
jgi:hypothetical protein